MPPPRSASSSCGVGRLDVLGDHEHGGAGHAPAHLERGAQPLVAEVRRQADVDDREVGPLRDHLAHQRVAVADRRHDLDLVVAQQPGQAVAQEREVLGDDYPHGSSARDRRSGRPAGWSPTGFRRAPRRGGAARADRCRSGSAPPDRRRAPRARACRRRGRCGCRPAAPARAWRRWRAPRRRRSRRRSRPPAPARGATSTDRSTRIGVELASDASAASRPRSASTGGWIPRARSRSSRSACSAPARASASSSPARSGILGELLLRHPEAHPERDQPRLRAVVQVALDPAQLGLLGVHRAGAAWSRASRSARPSRPGPASRAAARRELGRQDDRDAARIGHTGQK